MAPNDRIDLAQASGNSLTFYERIRAIRECAADLAAGDYVDYLRQLEIRDLGKLESTFLRYGSHLEQLLGRYPEDAELRAAIVAHDARKAALGL